MFSGMAVSPGGDPGASVVTIQYSNAGTALPRVLVSLVSSSTLVLRYFGSKARLFEAALRASMPLDHVTLDADRSRLGEKLAALFMTRELEIRPPSIVALATGDAEARAIATRVLQEEIIAPMARWLGPPDPQARALEILMLAMGFVLFTRQFPVIGTSKAQEKKVAAWLAESIQEIVDRP